MTTADGDQPPAATPSTFSSTNLAVLAIWVELASEASTAAADAWIRAHSAFVRGDGYITRLLVTPASGADEAVLRGEQPPREAGLPRHAGHRSNNVHRSTLEVEIRPASEHTGLERQAE